MERPKRWFMGFYSRHLQYSARFKFNRYPVGLTRDAKNAIFTFHAPYFRNMFTEDPIEVAFANSGNLFRTSRISEIKPKCWEPLKSSTLKGHPLKNLFEPASDVLLNETKTIFYTERFGVPERRLITIWIRIMWTNEMVVGGCGCGYALSAFRIKGSLIKHALTLFWS